MSMKQPTKRHVSMIEQTFQYNAFRDYSRSNPLDVTIPLDDNGNYIGQ